MAITKADIENDFDNKLLRRRELRVALEFDGGTPSREEIKKGLADKLNLKQDNLVIVRAGQLYGSRKGSVLVHEYYDAEAMRMAQKHVLERPKAKGKKEAKPQTATAAAPAAKEGEAEKK